MNRMIVAALLATALVAHAADRPNSPVQEFLALSGIKTGLDKIPAQIASELFGNMPASVPEATKREIARGYADAYPDGSITAAVARALSSGREAARIGHLKSLASTPVSVKMTALELKERNEKEFQGFAAALQSKPPGKERVTLLKEILDESHAVDLFATIAAETTESLAIATSSGCPDDMKRIRGDLAKGRAAMREAVLSSLMFSMLYTYRTATDDELKEYLASYRDPVAKGFHAQLAKLTAKEYLSRWKLFERTLDRVGEDLSNRSMFARSCRKPSSPEAMPAKTDAVDPTRTAPAKSVLAGKDARECLALATNAKIVACVERYR